VGHRQTSEFFPQVSEHRLLGSRRKLHLFTCPEVRGFDLLRYARFVTIVLLLSTIPPQSDRYGVGRIAFFGLSVAIDAFGYCPGDQRGGQVDKRHRATEVWWGVGGECERICNSTPCTMERQSFSFLRERAYSPLILLILKDLMKLDANIFSDAG
jgi:hypothetical protein